MDASRATQRNRREKNGRLQARWVEVVVGGRGAAGRERRARLWLPGPDGTIAPAALAFAGPPGILPGGPPDQEPQVGPGGPAGLALAGEGDAPAGEGRSPGSPLADAG